MKNLFFLIVCILLCVSCAPKNDGMNTPAEGIKSEVEEVAPAQDESGKEAVKEEPKADVKEVNPDETKQEGASQEQDKAKEVQEAPKAEENKEVKEEPKAEEKQEVKPVEEPAKKDGEQVA